MHLLSLRYFGHFRNKDTYMYRLAADMAQMNSSYVHFLLYTESSVDWFGESIYFIISTLFRVSESFIKLFVVVWLAQDPLYCIRTSLSLCYGWDRRSHAPRDIAPTQASWPTLTSLLT